MRNLKLLIEYDGTHFHGWQVQPELRTVQGVMQEVIARVVGHQVRLIGASRTDRGVHALGQVANFRTTSTLPPSTLQRAFNALLPGDVVVKAVEEVPPRFHARFSATGKVYEYRLLLSPWPSAILRHFCWHLPEHLDLDAMRECCKLLLGVHDFSSFQLSGSDTRHPFREVRRAEVLERSPGHVVVTLEANAFLRGMVRSIVGTLVDVGRGRISPEGFREIMEAQDRSRASPTAPPHGLFLLEVKY